ncbi:MAG: hypothetical protein WD003_02195 [Candidatus Paceibacterota bacterium]
MPRKISFIIIGILTLIAIGIFVAAFIIAPREDKTPVEVLRDFIPFGGGGADEPVRRPPQSDPSQDGDGLEDGPLAGQAGEGNALLQLSSTPVVGASFHRIGEDEKEHLTVRYVEQTTGNIFEVNPETLEKVRLTNTTLLALKRVLWSDDEKRLLVQYLDGEVIKTFMGNIVGGESGVGSLEGEFLEENIEALTLSPERDKVFSLRSFGDIVIGTILNIKNGDKEQVFAHPFKEWLVGWPTENQIILTTKPSNGVLGQSILLTLSNERIVPLLNNIPGLTTQPSFDGRNILYGEMRGQTLSRIISYNRESGNSLVFPLATLPEKCVWSRVSPQRAFCAVPQAPEKALYPDDWYRGVVSFSDEIWQLDVERGSVSQVTQESLNNSFDVINLELDVEERFLLFQNKKDGTLWRLKLE